MEPFKNNLSRDLVFCLADQLEHHLRSFDRKTFLDLVLPKLNELELKERSQLIADALHAVLPEKLEARYRILLAVLHPLNDVNDGGQSDKHGIRGWGMMPLCTVVGQHGQEDFEQSLAVLKEMTKRFSSEFDVRYFLLKDQVRALDIMSRWVHDEDFHVRRLVSEGTRPRLPWAMQLPQLIADPSPTLPLLKLLRDDEQEYVRRSVANHLNDIAKDHPDLVAEIAGEWMQAGNKQREKLLRHACRTLIKQGHPRALEVFGYAAPELSLESLTINTPSILLGETLDFSVCLQSISDDVQPLIIDYVVHHRKSNGKLTGKVFKWKVLELAPGAWLRLDRSHRIRKVTTRRYHTGGHALSLRINGQDYGYEEFYLQC